MLDRLPPRKIRQSAARRASQARLPPLPQAAQVLAGRSLTAKSLWVQLRALPRSKAQDNLRKARSQLRHPAPERRNIRRTNHDPSYEKEFVPSRRVDSTNRDISCIRRSHLLSGDTQFAERRKLWNQQR